VRILPDPPKNSSWESRTAIFARPGYLRASYL
jgi:hypothetical protein